MDGLSMQGLAKLAAMPPAAQVRRVLQRQAAASAPRATASARAMESALASDLPASQAYPELKAGRAQIDMEGLRRLAYGGAGNLGRVRGRVNASLERGLAAGELKADDYEALKRMASASNAGKHGGEIFAPVAAIDERLPEGHLGEYDVRDGGVSLRPDAGVSTLLHEAMHHRSGGSLWPSRNGGLGTIEPVWMRSARDGRVPDSELYSIIPEIKSAATRALGPQASSDASKMRGVLGQVVARNSKAAHEAAVASGKTAPYFGYMDYFRDKANMDRLFKLYPYVLGTAAAPAAVSALQAESQP